MAELAGIGVDWYVRLEQGRAVSPSASTIDALAKALRLSKAEHDILLSVLTDPASRALFGAKWAEEARRMVAQFRATHDLWAGNRHRVPCKVCSLI